jgi:hypothetical protein
VRMVHVYIHSILQMAVMDKVLCGFIDSFIQDRDVDSSREWTEVDGETALEEMCKFLDHLQGFIMDCFCGDCAEILSHFNQNSRSRKSPRSVRMLSTVASSSSSSSSASLSPSSRDFAIANACTEGATAAGDSEVMQFISEDELRNLISSAVRKQVEIEVYLPCSSRLTSLLDRAYFKPEKKVKHIISCIVNQPQSFYGIPVGRNRSTYSTSLLYCNCQHGVRHIVGMCMNNNNEVLWLFSFLFVFRSNISQQLGKHRLQLEGDTVEISTFRKDRLPAERCEGNS